MDTLGSCHGSTPTERTLGLDTGALDIMMSDVRASHDEAMALAQDAMVAQHRGDVERAEELARQAMELETQAADGVPYSRDSEPTRSILYRSAASLASQCREYQIAEHLIAKGLSGYPPPCVKAELKSLFEVVRFKGILTECVSAYHREQDKRNVSGMDLRHASA